MLVDARKLGKKRGNVTPNHVDYRGHIGLRLVEILFPVRMDFVQIQNRLIPTVADLFKERHVDSKLLMDERLMIATHGDNQIGPF